MNNETFLMYFMETLDYPKEAQILFQSLYQRIVSEPNYNAHMNTLIDMFMKEDVIQAFEELDILAKNMDVHSYTMSMLFLILCAKPLLSRYQEKGITEDIYWDSMRDLYYKLMECYDMYGIWGTFVRGWYPGFYQMTIFALGRLQYEYAVFELDDYKINGITVKKGDKVITMHIPSSGSLSEETRLDSYKKAYEFFKKEFGEKPIPMVCHSWLLYPKQREFLPRHLNISQFMNDFTYIKEETEDKFEDGWRVFGNSFDKGPKEWPRKTTLQKAYAEYLEKGGKTGLGYGIFLFDGENIIR